MTEPTVRRPKRIIPGIPSSDQAITSPLAERFRRALCLLPRRRNQCHRREETIAVDRSRAHSLTAARQTESLHLPSVVPNRPESTDPDTVISEKATNPREQDWTPTPDSAMNSIPKGDAIIEAPWIQTLVITVHSLCTNHGSSMNHWSIVLPLDARVLPESDLVLSFSHHRLSLRFETQSTYAHQLLLGYQPLLREMLSQSLPALRDIDIDVV